MNFNSLRKEINSRNISVKEFEFLINTWFHSLGSVVNWDEEIVNALVPSDATNLILVNGELVFEEPNSDTDAHSKDYVKNIFDKLSWGETLNVSVVNKSNIRNNRNQLSVKKTLSHIDLNIDPIEVDEFGYHDGITFKVYSDKFNELRD